MKKERYAVMMKWSNITTAAIATGIGLFLLHLFLTGETAFVDFIRLYQSHVALLLTFIVLTLSGVFLSFLIRRLPE